MTKEVGVKMPNSDGDELRAFIAGTLRAIMAGVSDVQEELVIPSAHKTGKFAFGPPTEVAFDIAVTAKRTGTKSGGLKLEVFSIGASAGVENLKENSTISRIAFAVPAHYKRDSE